MLCDVSEGVPWCEIDVVLCGEDSHFFFSNFAYKAEALRKRFVFAACDMGAVLMALMEASWMYLGIGLAPWACEGHEGEKWSFGVAQHGDIINQCE